MLYRVNGSLRCKKPVSVKSVMMMTVDSDGIKYMLERTSSHPSLYLLSDLFLIGKREGIAKIYFKTDRVKKNFRFGNCSIYQN